MKSINKKGQTFAYLVGGVFVVFMVVVLAVLMGWLGPGTTASFTGNGESVNSNDDSGVIVDSLSVLQTNKHTKATEGGDDLEFWDKGADIQDTSLTPRETIDLSSGAATDTSVPSLRSNFDQADMDLYIEGGSNYYDAKVSTWKIEYNVQTGTGALSGPGPADSVVAVDVGTIADIDSAEAVDTGFANNVGDLAGQVNYSITDGDGTGYIRIEIGNDESDSELQDLVFCIGDADGDLEGDELASMTISLYTGSSVGSINSNILPLFTQSAGTGSYVCTNIGDVVGLTKGTYQIDMEITEANFGADEEFEIGIDDLGGWKLRQYPSSNLKATAEDLVIARVS